MTPERDQPILAATRRPASLGPAPSVLPPTRCAVPARVKLQRLVPSAVPPQMRRATPPRCAQERAQAVLPTCSLPMVPLVDRTTWHALAVSARVVQYNVRLLAVRWASATPVLSELAIAAQSPAPTRRAPTTVSSSNNLSETVLPVDMLELARTRSVTLALHSPSRLVGTDRISKSRFQSLSS